MTLLTYKASVIGVRADYRSVVSGRLLPARRYRMCRARNKQRDGRISPERRYFDNGWRALGYGYCHLIASILSAPVAIEQTLDTRYPFQCVGLIAGPGAQPGCVSADGINACWPAYRDARRPSFWPGQQTPGRSRRIRTGSLPRSQADRQRCVPHRRAAAAAAVATPADHLRHRRRVSLRGQPAARGANVQAHVSSLVYLLNEVANVIPRVLTDIEYIHPADLFHNDRHWRNRMACRNCSMVKSAARADRFAIAHGREYRRQRQFQRGQHDRAVDDSTAILQFRSQALQVDAG